MELDIKSYVKNNIWYRMTRLSLIVFFVLLAVYVYLQVIFWVNTYRVSQQEEILFQRRQELNQISSSVWFSRLSYAKDLSDLPNLSWKQNISDLIDMVSVLQTVVNVEGSSINFTDLSVDADSISLRWSVNNLLLLYLSAPERSYLSVLDRFTQMDFIKDMRVQNYTRNQNWLYQFVLQANINHDRQ